MLSPPKATESKDAIVCFQPLGKGGSSDNLAGFKLSRALVKQGFALSSGSHSSPQSFPSAFSFAFAFLWTQVFPQLQRRFKSHLLKLDLRVLWIYMQKLMQPSPLKHSWAGEENHNRRGTPAGPPSSAPSHHTACCRINGN